MNQIKSAALARACSEVLRNDEAAQAYSILRAYLTTCQQKDVNDQGNWEDLKDQVIVRQLFLQFTPLSLQKTIEWLAQGIEKAMSSVLELAKEGLIQETIDSLGIGDLNSRYIVEQVEVNYQAPKERLRVKLKGRYLYHVLWLNIPSTQKSEKSLG
ncbi:hypothetical protein [Neopusillimonas maritima]|uniref:Uncharacterized protein n=1 Tax=Neopusillimonas maritima TaxID=2026239 RepID=A0A3A1YVE2_9BURK|nr:hypothetical protein [Neopusillimonas maritima]RIY41168.1 hypothetical protein CJP73_08465 [Neopusillimonas maritima]